MPYSAFAAPWRDKLRCFLAQFDTPETVRTYCQAQGITGQISIGTDCLIAEALKRHFDVHAVHVNLMTSLVVVTEVDGFQRQTRIRVKTPSPVLRAMAQFDGREWPELIRRTGRDPQ